jgi:hypothetical protein
MDDSAGADEPDLEVIRRRLGKAWRAKVESDNLVAGQ